MSFKGVFFLKLTLTNFTKIIHRKRRTPFHLVNPKLFDNACTLMLEIKITLFVDITTQGYKKTFQNDRPVHTNQIKCHLSDNNRVFPATQFDFPRGFNL